MANPKRLIAVIVGAAAITLIMALSYWRMKQLEANQTVYIGDHYEAPKYDENKGEQNGN